MASRRRSIGQSSLWIPHFSFANKAQAAPKFTLVVHGGAGVGPRKEMTPEKESAYRAKLAEALSAGHAVLKADGTSLEAVVAGIRILEDSPLFNAAKGAVLTADGTVELDAALMDGATRKAGAVAGVKRIRNPIELARLVMEKSPHVLMIGAGAEALAKQHGMPLVQLSYFITARRKLQLQRLQRQAGERVNRASQLKLLRGDHRIGTVGAVALDRRGHLAAGTSTGGLVNKRAGRVGDSPIIGAGTYADNSTCAVSATGQGEYLIRAVVAHDIAALIEYKGLTLADAANEVVMKKLVAMGGEGGVIAIDRKGNVAMPFNTKGMHRGFVGEDGKPETFIYER